MERVLNLAGKNSSEIFQLRYPFSLLTFCDYDLSYFAENAVAVCDEALRSGELDADRVTELRNTLKNMHVYIEHNLRTVYDKIVLDCWIDYVCRRDGIGTAAMWNRFIDCKTAFEKAVFVRLCEYRYNKGINEWLNLVRVQDYAKSKVFFVFSRDLYGVEEASARRNYFDLMFSVTARELGCRLEDMSVTQVFSAGRAPSAPFMYPSISKDIVKNVLSDFDYSDDYSDIGSYDAIADQIAMDAFSHMKAELSQELSSYNMSRPAIENAPGRIYMPCGLKAVVDLEIDALLESGGWLARCKRCGRYYVKDSEYTEDYCYHTDNGKTCLEIYEAEHPRIRVTPELEQQCVEITDEMYSRVTAGTLSLKEYESWRAYLQAMKDKVNNGEIHTDDLASFIAYSRSMDISRSNPVMEVRKPAPEPHERVVKPFVPQRISRSDISKTQESKRESEQTKEPAQHDGFFTSPSVERQKSQTRAVSHIIRADQSRTEPKPYNMPLNEVVQPERTASERGFSSFGESRDNDRRREQQESAVSERGFSSFGESRDNDRRREQQESAASEHGFSSYGEGRDNDRRREQQESAASEHGFSSYGESRDNDRRREQQESAASERGFSSFGESRDNDRRREQQESAVSEHGFSSYGESRDNDRRREQQESAASERGFSSYGESRDNDRRREQQESAASDRGFSVFGEDDEDTSDAYAQPEPESVNPEPVRQETARPAPRIIRRNAAAISAYGKMAGTSVKQEKAFEAVSRPEEAPPNQETPSAEPEQSGDPFWEIGSIFDVLEKSENDMSKEHRHIDEPEKETPPHSDESQENHSDGHTEPKKHRSSHKQHEDTPQPEVPDGIWTEDRHIYDEEPASPTHEELNMLKDKKRRSSKTQRLFDAIMKEPDDNPNFRKR